MPVLKIKEAPIPWITRMKINISIELTKPHNSVAALNSRMPAV